MASKSSKTSKDTLASMTTEAISELLEQHRGALSAKFWASFSLPETKFDQVHNIVQEHGLQLSSLELARDNLSQRVHELEHACSKLKLTANVSDLEGRSWRKNRHIPGLTEVWSPYRVLFQPVA